MLFQILLIGSTFSVVVVGLFLISIGKSLRATCGMDFSVMGKMLRSRRGRARKSEREKKEGDLIPDVFGRDQVLVHWRTNRPSSHKIALSQ